MIDDAASKRDGATSLEAGVELNRAVCQARYHREVRKPRIAAGAETRRCRAISEGCPPRTGFQPLNGASS